MIANDEGIMELNALRMATIKILDDARCNSGRFQDWCCNWGSLTCTEAQRVQNDQREEHLRVIVSAASHDNGPLCKYVADELAFGGWDDVEVTCEW